MTFQSFTPIGLTLTFIFSSLLIPGIANATTPSIRISGDPCGYPQHSLYELDVTVLPNGIQVEHNGERGPVIKNTSATFLIVDTEAVKVRFNDVETQEWDDERQTWRWSSYRHHGDNGIGLYQIAGVPYEITKTNVPGRVRGKPFSIKVMYGTEAIVINGEQIQVTETFRCLEGNLESQRSVEQGGYQSLWSRVWKLLSSLFNKS